MCEAKFSFLGHSLQNTSGEGIVPMVQLRSSHFTSLLKPLEVRPLNLCSMSTAMALEVKQHPNPYMRCLSSCTMAQLVFCWMVFKLMVSLW